MPQLDSASFLAQYCWSVAGFFLLYHLLASFVLPLLQCQLGARRSFTQSPESSSPAFPLFLSSLFLFD